MIFAGGIPLKKGGKVVGAIGVSGGSGDQDHALPKPCRGVLAHFQEDKGRHTMASNRGLAYMGPGNVEIQSIDYPKLASEVANANMA